MDITLIIKEFNKELARFNATGTPARILFTSINEEDDIVINDKTYSIEQKSYVFSKELDFTGSPKKCDIFINVFESGYEI